MIVVDLESSTFSPHVTKNILKMIEGRRPTIEVAYNEVLMYLRSLLEDRVRYKHTKTTRVGQSNRRYSGKRTIPFYT